MVFPGWIVERSIPYETLLGLMTGKYTIHGGVIRWAKGTAKGGQIVAHLLAVGPNPLKIVPGLDFIPGIVANIQLEQLKGIAQFNTYQLAQLSGKIYSLSQSTQQILQLATGTAILSGLGLAVSSISFAVINNKLNVIDGRLKEIQKDIQEIKNFLESGERAKLWAAINALLKIDADTPPEHRHTILHHSRNTLSEIHMRYRELLSEANTIETAMAREEYLVLTGLAQIRCTAELGMLDIAYKEAEEINCFWQTQAHRIAQEILIGKHPERFLATDFVDVVSVAELIQWLDFVHAEIKGLGWIDELRRKFNESWYSKGLFSNSGSGLNQNVGIGLEKEQKLVIPSLRKLVARSSVFEGYVAQYEILRNYQTTPSEFEKSVASLPKSSSVEDYLILKPNQEFCVGNQARTEVKAQ